MGNILNEGDIQKAATKWQEILAESVKDNDLIRIVRHRRKDISRPRKTITQSAIDLLTGKANDLDFPGLEKQYETMSRVIALAKFKESLLEFPSKLVIFHPNYLLASYKFKPSYLARPLRASSDEKDQAWYRYFDEWCLAQSMETIYFPLEATSFHNSYELYSNNPWPLGFESLDTLKPLARFIPRDEAYALIEPDLYRCIRPNTLGLELLAPELGDVYMITSDSP